MIKAAPDSTMSHSLMLMPGFAASVKSYTIWTVGIRANVRQKVMQNMIPTLISQNSCMMYYMAMNSYFHARPTPWIEEIHSPQYGHKKCGLCKAEAGAGGVLIVLPSISDVLDANNMFDTVSGVLSDVGL